MSLYYSKRTSHRVLISGKKRVVYARYDWEGNFVRHFVKRTASEMEKARREYLPAKVGIASWFEVLPHSFLNEPGGVYV